MSKIAWRTTYCVVGIGFAGLVLIGLNLINGEPLQPERLGWIGIFVAASVFGALTLQIGLQKRSIRTLAVALVLLLALGVATILPQKTQPGLALLFVAGMFAATVRLGGWLVAESKPALKAAGYAVVGLWIGGVIAALAQIEIRFSEEEFFVLVQALQLAAAWWVLAFVDRLLVDAIDKQTSMKSIQARRLVWLFLLFSSLGLGWWVLRAYQDSFYGTAPPEFPQITDQNPFLCGKSEPAGDVFSASQVQDKLIDLVAANPAKTPSEYGMLALARPNQGWDQQFRASLLDEARSGLFTEPAFSVKYGQCLAARRVYFFGRLRSVQPDLFNEAETATLAGWFSAINRRAMTIEPVDWFYALAFRFWPQGPYENQECGAALLAQLEIEKLSDPALSKSNQSYLNASQRGWEQRYRNSDDAYVYQEEWLINAYLQSLGKGEISPKDQELSYEWFLLQTLPDGSALRYNHIGSSAAAYTAYLASSRLGREDYLWLAGRSIETLQDASLAARPGMENKVEAQAQPPDWGSCLLFGQTGLPTRLGPLAPDKVVFRGNWQADSLYLLMNLRFTGWHRYKATQTAVLLYQAGPLAGEDNRGAPFQWLPRGRSLFRDKRIPRQNLNGLVIPRAGLDAALYRILGAGGPWAQDPPFYAEVKEFTTGVERDVSVTQISDWHGWQHTRKVYFYHSGLLVLVDDANGPAGEQPGLVWKLYHPPQALDAGPGLYRYRIREGASPAEMALFSAESMNPELSLTVELSGQNGMSGMFVQPMFGGSLRIVTVFMTQNWAGASLDWNPERGSLRVQAGELATEVELK